MDKSLKHLERSALSTHVYANPEVRAESRGARVPNGREPTLVPSSASLDSTRRLLRLKSSIPRALRSRCLAVATLCALLLLPSLAACNFVGDARSQFCANMRNVDSAVGQLKDSKVISTVGQLRDKVKGIRDALSTAAAIAPPGLGINFDGLIKSLDELEKAAQALPDDMPIQEALTKIGGAADNVKKQYDAVYDSVCSAK